MRARAPIALILRAIRKGTNKVIEAKPYDAATCGTTVATAAANYSRISPRNNWGVGERQNGQASSYYWGRRIHWLTFGRRASRTGACCSRTRQSFRAGPSASRTPGIFEL